MIIRIIIINLLSVFISGIFFNINAESLLSREIRGFPYGSQEDSKLLDKSVEFKCAQSKISEFQVEKYLIALNNNPDYPLRRMFISDTIKILLSISKDPSGHSTYESASGSYLEMKYTKINDIIAHYGPILEEEKGYKSFKLPDNNYKAKLQKYLIASYTPYVYGYFAHKPNTQKLLALKPYSKDEQEILDHDDFDSYRIDCSEQELKNTATEVVAAISRGDIFPSFRIEFRGKNKDKINNLISTASKMDDILKSWKKGNDEPVPIENLLFFEPQEDDLETIMLDIDLNEPPEKLKDLIKEYFSKLDSSNSVPQFLKEVPKSWDKIASHGKAHGEIIGLTNANLSIPQNQHNIDNSSKLNKESNIELSETQNEEIFYPPKDKSDQSDIKEENEQITYPENFLIKFYINNEPYNLPYLDNDFSSILCPDLYEEINENNDDTYLRIENCSSELGDILYVKINDKRFKIKRNEYEIDEEGSEYYKLNLDDVTKDFTFLFHEQWSDFSERNLIKFLEIDEDYNKRTYSSLYKLNMLLCDNSPFSISNEEFDAGKKSINRLPPECLKSSKITVKINDIDLNPRIKKISLNGEDCTKKSQGFECEIEQEISETISITFNDIKGFRVKNDVNNLQVDNGVVTVNKEDLIKAGLTLKSPFNSKSIDLPYVDISTDEDKKPYQIDNIIFLNAYNEVCGDIKDYKKNIPSFKDYNCLTPHFVQFDLSLESESKWLKNKLKCVIELFNETERSRCNPNNSLKVAYRENNINYNEQSGYKKNNNLIIYSSEDCSEENLVGIIRDDGPQFLDGSKNLSKGKYWATLSNSNNNELVTNCVQNTFSEINKQNVVFFDLISLFSKSDNTITVVLSFIDEMKEGGRSTEMITALKNIFEIVHETYDRDKILYDINFLTINKENKIDLFYSTPEIPEQKKERKIARELLKINGTDVIDFDKLWDNEVVKKASNSEGGGLFFIVSNALEDSITRDKALDVIDNGAEFKVFQTAECPEKKRFKNLCYEINSKNIEVLEQTVLKLLN